MISPHAIVESKQIGNNVAIGEFAIVRDGAVLGDNVIVHPYVLINGGVTVANDVEIFPGALLGKEPKGAGALARTPKFTRRVVIGAGCSIGPHVVIFYDVEIGDSTLLGDGASVREGCRIGSRCIISRYVTINYETRIGNRTKVMDNTHVTGKCIIGDDVFISLQVGMANDKGAGRQQFNETELRGPSIDDGATIGVGAILLPGVRIGSGAVVAAGSLVNKDVASNTVVAGSPARFVRRTDE